ncbi:hypothetical protein EDD18DRAFT_1079399 [Armillaria luteobubalina]|uniref:Uncharacterized protein n=1 Tax=Armillaria luteobubalina TaxID=153913 RepID=A0AA39PYX0_9AGAR|nr:hypothetical protein EDD18DRAFT_1079399 [Armillaria luteobubalina]
MKWAHIQLPNNQIARSRWKEGKRPIVDIKEHQNPTQFGEVLFFTVLPNVNGIDQPIALVSLYGKPDPVCLQASNGTYYTAKHHGNDGLVAVDIHTVKSVVAMIPDKRYPGGTDAGYWYMYEKMGLKILQWLGEDVNVDLLNTVTRPQGIYVCNFALLGIAYLK